MIVEPEEMGKSSLETESFPITVPDLELKSHMKMDEEAPQEVMELNVTKTETRSGTEEEVAAAEMEDGEIVSSADDEELEILPSIRVVNLSSIVDIEDEENSDDDVMIIESESTIKKRKPRVRVRVMPSKHTPKAKPVAPLGASPKPIRITFPDPSPKAKAVVVGFKKSARLSAKVKSKQKVSRTAKSAMDKSPPLAVAARQTVKAVSALSPVHAKKASEQQTLRPKNTIPSAKEDVIHIDPIGKAVPSFHTKIIGMGGESKTNSPPSPSENLNPAASVEPQLELCRAEWMLGTKDTNQFVTGIPRSSLLQEFQQKCQAYANQVLTHKTDLVKSTTPEFPAIEVSTSQVKEIHTKQNEEKSEMMENLQATSGHLMDLVENEDLDDGHQIVAQNSPASCKEIDTSTSNTLNPQLDCDVTDSSKPLQTQIKLTEKALSWYSLMKMIEAKVADSPESLHAQIGIDGTDLSKTPRKLAEPMEIDSPESLQVQIEPNEADSSKSTIMQKVVEPVQIDSPESLPMQIEPNEEDSSNRKSFLKLIKPEIDSPESLQAQIGLNEAYWSKTLLQLAEREPASFDSMQTPNSINETAPNESALNEPEPGESTPNEPAPKESERNKPELSEPAPNETEPNESTADEPEPSEPLPNETEPNEPEPGESTLNETKSGESTPIEPEPGEGESTLKETKSGESTPNEPEPGESTPKEPEPGEGESALKETKSGESTPNEPPSNAMAKEVEPHEHETNKFSTMAEEIELDESDSSSTLIIDESEPNEPDTPNPIAITESELNEVESNNRDSTKALELEEGDSESSTPTEPEETLDPDHILNEQLRNLRTPSPAPPSPPVENDTVEPASDSAANPIITKQLDNEPTSNPTLANQNMTMPAQPEPERVNHVGSEQSVHVPGNLNVIPPNNAQNMGNMPLQNQIIQISSFVAALQSMGINPFMNFTGLPTSNNADPAQVGACNNATAALAQNFAHFQTQFTNQLYLNTQTNISQPMGHSPNLGSQQLSFLPNRQNVHSPGIQGPHLLSPPNYANSGFQPFAQYTDPQASIIPNADISQVQPTQNLFLNNYNNVPAAAAVAKPNSPQLNLNQHLLIENTQRDQRASEKSNSNELQHSATGKPQVPPENVPSAMENISSDEEIPIPTLTAAEKPVWKNVLNQEDNIVVKVDHVASKRKISLESYKKKRSAKSKAAVPKPATAVTASATSPANSDSSRSTWKTYAETQVTTSPEEQNPEFQKGRHSPIQAPILTEAQIKKEKLTVWNRLEPRSKSPPPPTIVNEKQSKSKRTVKLTASECFQAEAENWETSPPMNTTEQDIKPVIHQEMDRNSRDRDRQHRSVVEKDRESSSRSERRQRSTQVLERQDSSGSDKRSSRDVDQHSSSGSERRQRDIVEADKRSSSGSGSDRDRKRGSHRYHSRETSSRRDRSRSSGRRSSRGRSPSVERRYRPHRQVVYEERSKYSRSRDNGDRHESIGFQHRGFTRGRFANRLGERSHRGRGRFNGHPKHDCNSGPRSHFNNEEENWEAETPVQVAPPIPSSGHQDSRRRRYVSPERQNHQRPEYEAKKRRGDNWSRPVTPEPRFVPTPGASSFFNSEFEDWDGQPQSHSQPQPVVNAHVHQKERDEEQEEYDREAELIREAERVREAARIREAELLREAERIREAKLARELRQVRDAQGSGTGTRKVEVVQEPVRIRIPPPPKVAPSRVCTDYDYKGYHHHPEGHSGMGDSTGVVLDSSTSRYRKVEWVKDSVTSGPSPNYYNPYKDVESVVYDYGHGNATETVVKNKAQKQQGSNVYW